jgi:sodium-dependent phosphate cotransporter
MVAAFAHLFFNIFGIIVIYLNPLLKNIPIKLAEWMADVSVKNKFIPILYLLVFFFALPFIIILTGR